MKYRVTLAGKIYEVEVEQGDAVLLAEYEAASPVVAVAEQPAVSAPKQETRVAQTSAKAGDKTIVSQLPGTVVQLKKNAGDSVKRGEVVAVVEAMKMENDISATEDCVVTAVLVAKGATIAQGAALYAVK